MSLPKSLKNVTNLWKDDTWVRPLIAQHKRTLATSLGLGVAAVLFAVGLMFVSGFLISDAAEQPVLGLFSLLIPLGLVQIFGIGKPFLSYFERLNSHDWVFRITSDLRRKLFATIEKDGVVWTMSHRVGDALGLLAEDIDHVQNLYIRTVFPLVIAWIVGILITFVLGLFSPLLGIVMLTGLFSLAVLVPVVALARNAARKQSAQAAAHDLYAQAFDDITGIADWTFAGRKTDFIQSVTAQARTSDAEDARVASSLRAYALLTNTLFSLLCVVVLVWAAIHFASIPQDVAATGIPNRPADWLAAFVLGFFPLLETLSPLPEATTHSLDHIGAIERLNALDNTDQQKAGQQQPEDRENPKTDAHDAHPCAPYTIALDQVNYAYPHTSRLVLNDVNLTIRPGEKVAVLGPSGSGKSTLLMMLRGDIAPSSGCATLGLAPLSSLGDSACDYINLVQQSSYLFNQTLYENLSLGDPTITREDALLALQRVRMGDVVEHLPNGLDTMAKEAGLRFSGGQRQRIALARVLLRQSPIVLLDEPSTGLDPLTERELLDEIFEVLDGRTIIMVTHHLAGLHHVDRVVFMNDGAITMDGAPHELAASNERFKALLAFDRGVSATG